MQFGNYGSTGVVTHHFQKEPEWVWLIKTADWGSELERDKLFVGYEVVTDKEGSVHRKVTLSTAALIGEEIWLTFAGTNIPASVNKDLTSAAELKPGAKNLYIPHGVTQKQFMLLLAGLWPPMVEEIHRAVMEVNPHWMPGFLAPSTAATSNDE